MPFALSFSGSWWWGLSTLLEDSAYEAEYGEDGLRGKLNYSCENGGFVQCSEDPFDLQRSKPNVMALWLCISM